MARRDSRRGVTRRKGSGSGADEQLMKRVKDSQRRQQRGRGRNFLNPEKVGDLTFWRPSKEVHTFDIIPYKAGANDIEVEEGNFAYTCEVRLHSRVGPNKRGQFICLADHFGKPCPICEDQERLREEGIDDKIVNALYPRTRYLYNVHVLTNDKERRKGVQILDVAARYLEEPLSEKAQTFVRKKKKMIETWVNFPAPSEEGKTIKVKVGTQTVPINDNPTQIPDWTGHDFIDRDEPLSKKILKQAHVLDELLYVPTYEEVYDAYHYQGDGEEEEDEDEPRKGKKGKNSKKDKKTQKIKSVSDFDDEDDLRDYLEGLSFRQLEKFHEKNDLEDDVEWDDDWDEGEAVDKIMGVVEIDEEDEDEEGECPEGYDFGEDCNNHDECQECPEDIYDRCYAMKHGEDEDDED